MNKYIYLIAATMLFNCFSFAQIEDKKVCGTTKIMQEALQDPEKKQILDQLEIFTQEFIQNIDHNRLEGPYIIPVVVHVIHNYGPENISYEQIDNGILRINEDFKGDNDDLSQVIDSFTNVIGFPDIKFRLATKDPDGNPTYGVTRTASVWTDNGGPSTVRPLVNWDNKKYANIYVVRSFTEEMSGAAAYATKPGSGGSEYGDYIFCTYNYFGDWNPNTGNGPTLGNWTRHTMPHEMGHFFNLDHPWGGSNEPGDEDTNCAMDDGVEDTPPTAGVPNGGCDLEQRTCDGSLDNVQNIMDYSNCALMFTQGQSDRMLAAANSFAGNRYYLWQSDNLINTGTNDEHWNDTDRYAGISPIPDFQSDIDLGCAGSDISFDNFTYNYRTENITYNWVFENGTEDPTTSTATNPVIQYNKPGTYDVTLEACNDGQFCQSVTRYDYITILSATDVDPQDGLTEIQGFEAESFPNINTDNSNDDDDEIWWIGDNHGEQHWERTTLSSKEGNASFRIKSQNYGYQRRSHEFSTPTLNLVDFSTSNSDPLQICFDYAYARRLPYNKVNYDESTGLVDGDVEGFSIHNDALIVSYKTSCDGNWIERPRLSTRPGEEGSFLSQQEQLITADKIYFNSFTPTDDEWGNYCISIQALAGSSEVVLKFEFVGTGDSEEELHWVNAEGFLMELTSSSIGGNWLYIDNFIVGNESDFIDDETSRSSNLENLIISPNPSSSNEVTIMFEVLKEGPVNLSLTNLFGRNIGVKTLNLSIGQHEFALSELFKISTKGAYIINVQKFDSHLSEVIMIR